jgi:hypothetical protein
MKLIIGIYFFFMAAIMIIKPKAMWKITDSWKTKINAEPTKLYLMLIRIGGCILAIGGIFVFFQM